MASLLRMPGVSADSEEAVLEAWTIEAGSHVLSGDTIATVETEKAVVDIDVDKDSVIHTLLAAAGATVPVGDPIAVLLDPGEPHHAAEELLREITGFDAAASGQPAPAAAEPGPAPAAGPEPVPEPATVPAPEPATVPAAGSAQESPAPQAPAGPEAAILPAESGAAGGQRVFASPIARRLAKELKIDMVDLTGSGPNGRITRDDVKAAAAQAPSLPAGEPAGQPAAAPAPAVQAPATQAPAASAQDNRQPTLANSVATPHTKLRRVIASRLQESKRNAPHFYLSAKLRLDEMESLRATINASSPVRVSVNDFFVKAAAKALIDVPEMNVIWTDDAVLAAGTADIAVAVASEKGLVTPVIRNIDSLSLTALSTQIKDAVSRANAGRLQQNELEGGTMSVTNLGMFGVDEFSAIINPPHAAILAIGAARREVVVGDDDELSVATLVTVTLSVDHRPVDGVIAAKWLARLRQLIESPMQIVI